MNRNGNTTAKAPATSKSAKPATLKDFILSQRDLIQTALPNNMNAERFARLILLNVNQNPALGRCEPFSLLAAAMAAAQLGLEPGGVLGQAYLIPYGNKVQFQIGYRGMIELARRSGSIKTIMAHEVFENDFFEYSQGFDETLVHKPVLTDRGEAIAYYATATLNDGGRAMVVMSKQDIEKHRDKFSQAHKKSSSPWQTDFPAMAKKTVLKQLLKFLPVSVELLKQAESDGSVKNDIRPDMVDIPTDDIVFTPFDGDVVDGELETNSGDDA